MSRRGAQQIPSAIATRSKLQTEYGVYHLGWARAQIESIAYRIVIYHLVLFVFKSLFDSIELLRSLSLAEDETIATPKEDYPWPSRDVGHIKTCEVMCCRSC